MTGLMIQGTGSDVGKSLIVAGLCRALARRGFTVRPFKPQNMSNNAAVTVDGGEIGRAQALQSRACRVAPTVDMNPILLKPESGSGAQVVVRGRRVARMSARGYMRERGRFLEAAIESYRRLERDADIVLVEGAGSPAEINLRDGDLANMGFAEAVDLPVVLVADIHRGGVIAALVGTLEVISPEDAARIQSFIINKFHGDPTLFDAGVRYLEDRTGRRIAGVVPHFPDARKLPQEDVLGLEAGLGGGKGYHVVVPRLARIANFDDLDPLRNEPNVRLTLLQPGEALPGDADLVLLPGSKATVADLAFLRDQGWDVDISAHVRRGGHVLGVCGGYQMLGTALHDPDGIEGITGSVAGLGLLDVKTVMTPEKALQEVSGRHVATGSDLTGYEMHIGRTDGPDRARPFAELGAAGPQHLDGAVSASGQIMGTYLHGMFAADDFRRAFLSALGARPDPLLRHDVVVEETLDALAAHLEAHLDIDGLLAIAHGGDGQVFRGRRA
ncbi:MAG: cobyric acid synthase [Pseudomonadota bacterium]